MAAGSQRCRQVLCQQRGTVWGLFLMYTLRTCLTGSLQGLMLTSSIPQNGRSSCIALREPSVCEVWFAKVTDYLHYWLERESPSHPSLPRQPDVLRSARGATHKREHRPDGVVGHVWVLGRNDLYGGSNLHILGHFHKVDAGLEHRRLIHILHTDVDGRGVTEGTQVQEPHLQVRVGTLYFQGVAFLALKT